MPALLSFLNTTKYPASLLFLLMTLGPTIALLPLRERFPALAVAQFGHLPYRRLKMASALATNGARQEQRTSS